MKIFARLLFPVAVMFVMTLPAWCMPTLYGDTGLVLAPTADTIPDANLSVAVNLMKLRGVTDDQDAQIYPIRVTYGITSNSEIFLLFSESQSNNGAGFDTLGGGLKIKIVQEASISKRPGVAVGVRAIKMKQSADTNEVQAYLVISRALFMQGDLQEGGYALRLHAGGAYTQYSGATDASFVNAFGGISYENANRTSFAVDYLPKLEDDGVIVQQVTLSGALRYPLSEHSMLEIGSTRPFGVGESNSYSVGLIYQFDSDSGDLTPW